MESLRGFGITGVLAALLVLLGGSYEIRGLPLAPIGAPLVILWAWLSKTPWSELGFVWPLVVAHTSFDLTALALIYFGLEAEVAGSVFG